MNLHEVQRYALAVEYDGQAFHGWQAQAGGLPTIQGALESALGQVANHRVGVVCAGRTDAGVHATAQVVHFDTDAKRDVSSWVFGCNSNLPADISVRWVKAVDRDFHARFDAQMRTYRYVIYANPVRNSILRHHITWSYRPLDLALMQAAANHLVGEHDFTSFRARHCQAKTPVRCLESITVFPSKQYAVVEFRANAFLHHMVRNIMGVLLPIATGERPVDWAREVLAAKDRAQAGVTAPPNGLYLVAVTYPDQCQLPVLPMGPRFV